MQPYYFGDYYPLTPWSLDNGAWLAWQYDRPDLNSGVVLAFRRPDNRRRPRHFTCRAWMRRRHTVSMTLTRIWTRCTRGPN